MSANPLETQVNIFYDDTKNFIEVVPPIEEFEFVALECTGAGERLFDIRSSTENKTTLWYWRITEAEGLVPSLDLDAIMSEDLNRFTTRAFAHQVLLIRELKGHTVNITDNL